ncbi:MAG: hypothetical protein ABH812_01960 [bacterium]
MGNFNRVLSFILGLVVVIVFVIVLSRRFNLQSKFIPFGNNTTPTPKIEKTTKDTSKEASKESTKEELAIKFIQPEEQSSQLQQETQQIQSIPETGPSSLLLLAYGASGVFGFYLRKTKK